MTIPNRFFKWSVGASVVVFGLLWLAFVMTHGVKDVLWVGCIIGAIGMGIITAEECRKRQNNE